MKKRKKWIYIWEIIKNHKKIHLVFAFFQSIWEKEDEDDVEMTGTHQFDGILQRFIHYIVSNEFRDGFPFTHHCRIQERCRANCGADEFLWKILEKIVVGLRNSLSSHRHLPVHHIHSWEQAEDPYGPDSEP